MRYYTPSAIKVTRLDDGVIIEVPPAGVWKGSGGLIWDAVVWNVLLAFCTGLAVWGLVRIGKLPSISLPLLFMLLFWLIGMGMLAHSIIMGRRSAVLVVSNGWLMATQTGPFGSRTKEWPLGDVQGIRVRLSLVSRAGKPSSWIQELQIFDGNRRKFGLLVGRNGRELEWIAFQLREALELSWPDADD